MPKIKFKIIFLAIFLLLIIIFIYITFFMKGTWNRQGKFSLAIAQSRGDIDVITFDPDTDSIKILTIPSNTLLEVSRNYGKWKVGNIRELGENENLQGQLIPETLTSSLYIPIDSWADEKASGFGEANRQFQRSSGQGRRDISHKG